MPEKSASCNFLFFNTPIVLGGVFREHQCTIWKQLHHQLRQMTLEMIFMGTMKSMLQNP